MQIDAPCKGCKKRSEGCHSACGIYLVYREYRQRKAAERVRKMAEDPRWMRNRSRDKAVRKLMDEQKRGRK